MEQIKISLSEVTATAAKIRSLSLELDEVLSRTSRLMNELSSVWISPGANSIVERFNVFARKFLEESEAIEAYARFLDYTVTTYDSMEAVIEANAAGFE